MSCQFSCHSSVFVSMKQIVFCISLLISIAFCQDELEDSGCNALVGTWGMYNKFLSGDEEVSIALFASKPDDKVIAVLSRNGTYKDNYSFCFNENTRRYEFNNGAFFFPLGTSGEYSNLGCGGLLPGEGRYLESITNVRGEPELSGFMVVIDEDTRLMLDTIYPHEERRFYNEVLQLHWSKAFNRFIQTVRHELLPTEILAKRSPGCLTRLRLYTIGGLILSKEFVQFLNGTIWGLPSDSAASKTPLIDVAKNHFHRLKFNAETEMFLRDVAFVDGSLRRDGDRFCFHGEKFPKNVTVFITENLCRPEMDGESMDIIIDVGNVDFPFSVIGGLAIPLSNYEALSLHVSQ